MNSTGVTVSDSPTLSNLFDEFEESFRNCFAPLTREDALNNINQDELKANSEANAQKFLDLAHRMKASFLQKRLLLSVQRPELLLMEENAEMRAEISRKDELIEKHSENLAKWQSLLCSRVGVGVLPPHGVKAHMAGIHPGASQGNIHMIGQPGATVVMPGINPGNPIPLSSMGYSPSVPHPINHMNQPGMLTQVSGSGGTFAPGSLVGPGGSGNPQLTMSGAQTTTIGAAGGGSGPSGGPGSIGSGPGTMGSGPVTMGSGPGTMGSGPGTMGPRAASSTASSMLSMQQSSGNMFQGGQGTLANQGGGPGGLQGPLAYLEKTTTNIGMPEGRR